MSTFILSLRNITPIVLGQWLTLDAILDGVLENEGLAPEARILPILAWDGTKKHAGLSTAQVRERSLVHMASAMRVKGLNVAIDDDTRIEATRPAVSNYTFRSGHNSKFFGDGGFPFVADSGREANLFQPARLASALKLTQRLCLAPTRVEWLVQGDAKAIIAILERAPGIGAKIAAGMGRFDAGSIHVEVLDDAAETSGILDEDGAFVHRPVPKAMAPGNARARLAQQTCRTPYWDRSLAEVAAVPLSRHHDGLLTL